MVFLNPFLNARSQLLGECRHFLGFLIGYCPAEFVARQIPFLAESIEPLDQLGVGTHGEGQGLDHPEVVGLTRRPITRCGQRCRRRLKRGIVGDIEPPVRGQALRPGSFEIAVRQ